MEKKKEYHRMKHIRSVVRIKLGDMLNEIQLRFDEANRAHKKNHATHARNDNEEEEGEALPSGNPAGGIADSNGNTAVIGDEKEETAALPAGDAAKEIVSSDSNTNTTAGGSDDEYILI